VTTADAHQPGPIPLPRVAKVLVPVDYSEHSGAVLALAFAFAVPLGAEVTVLHVWETQPSVPLGLKCKTPDGQTRRVVDLVQEEAERAMHDFMATVRVPDGARVATKVSSGPAAAAIMKEADAGHFDVIVIGAQGQTAVERAVLGSVAERVVRMSKVPVVTVPISRR